MLDRGLRRERWMVWFFLTIISLNLTHLIRFTWLTLCHQNCFLNPVPRGEMLAPGAYRVALPALQLALVHLFHLRDGTLADAAIQLGCCLTALYLLYRLTVRTEEVGSPRRLIAVLFFLVFVQFPLAFVVHLQRPETVPTALYLAFALTCLANAREGWYWTALLMLATLCQSLVRTDAAFILGLAIVGLSCWGDVLAPFGSRLGNLARGAGLMLIAGGMQAYLQLVRFPHLPYDRAGVGMVIVMRNLRPDLFQGLLLALLPFAVVIVVMIWQRQRVTAVDAVALTAAGLYLPLWFVVGSFAEVRIYVPFLLALCPMAGRVCSGFMVGMVEGRAVEAG